MFILMLNTQCAPAVKLTSLRWIMGCIMNYKVRYEMNVRLFNHYGMDFCWRTPLVIPNGLMPFKVMFIFTAKHDIIIIQNDNGLVLVGGRNTRLLS